MIDARADVHPEAIIGENVSIGPWTVIGPKVTIGAGTEIASHVVICGRTRLIQISRRTRIIPMIWAHRR